MALSNPTMLATIYGLQHPVTEQILYIGKTNNEKHRYRSHLKEYKRTKKCEWVRKLKSEGLKPNFIIIDKVPICNWQYWEREYIKIFKTLGAPLKNLTDGGGTVSKRTRSKTKIPILQYDLEGNFIKEWSSIGEAAEINKTISRTIDAACKNIIRSCKGYMWRRKSKEINEGKIPAYVPHNYKPHVSVWQYDLNGNFTREWEYIADAAREYKTQSNGIKRACNKETLSAAGFTWRFKIGNKAPNKVVLRKNINVEPIVQMDLNGNVVAKFGSAAEASRITGKSVSGILGHCKGIYKGDPNKYNRWKFTFKKQNTE